MHIRRLVKAGPTSHTVSLPKEWLEKNNLAKGSTIYVHEQSDSELLITPHLDAQPVEQKTITINIDGKELGTIQREITAAYVNNASSIDLLGEDIAKHAKEVRRMLHDFVALEIAEQSATKITAKDLLNLQEISVDKSVKRMDIIVRTMLQDSLSTASGKNLSESVSVRDEDVNRLYFLLVRLLKNAVKNPNTAAQLELEPSSVLHQWMLVHHLEQLADATKSLCSACVDVNSKEKKQVQGLLAQLEHDYRDVMKAVHEKDKALADEVARRRIDRQETAAGLDPELGHSGSTISSLISDIARLVIDE